MPFIATLLLVLLAVISPNAECRGDEAPLTLNGCIHTAIENNHAYLAERENLNAAKAGIGKATSGFLPRVDVSETYMRSDNPVMAFGAKLNQGRFTAADFAVDRLNNPRPIDNFNFRAQVTQPIFNGGKEWVALKRAKLNAEASGMGLERARQDLVYRVVQAYYGVLLAGEYCKVAEAAVKDTDGHVQTATKFFEQGMLIGSEVLSSKVRFAEAREMLVRANNRLDIARAVLNMVMARPQDTRVLIGQELEYQEFQGSLPELQKEALEARPDLRGLALNVENAAAGITLAKTDYLPNLNFIARYELDDKDIFKGRGDSYTLLGLISWNLFDGFMTTSSVREAKARHNSSRQMQEQMREGVLLEVRQSWNAVQEARERIEISAASVKEAEESFRIIQRRFANGLSKTIDVMDAETSLTRARMSRAQALYDYNTAVAAVKLSVGRKEY
jgi:TolC family type I secretion outer membrane protein